VLYPVWWYPDKKTQTTITTERYTMDATQLKRIADALEEVLRLVKEDQERSRKYMEDRKDD